MGEFGVRRQKYGNIENIIENIVPKYKFSKLRKLS